MSDESKGGHKTREANTAKVARRRANAKAEQDVQGSAKPLAEHANHLLPPTRELGVDLPSIEIAGVDAVPVGAVLGGITDFKILRASVASLNLTTSIEFRHQIVDLAAMSQGNVLLLLAYQIPRAAVFEHSGHPDRDDRAGSGEG